MGRTHKCCVPGCEESGRAINQPLHGFPDFNKKYELFATWVISIGGDIVSLDKDYIYRNRRVCRVHFEEKFLCANNRINKNAVPTLHIPETRAIPQSESSPVLTQAKSQKLALKCSKGSVYPITEKHREARENIVSIMKKLCIALRRKEIDSAYSKAAMKLSHYLIFEKYTKHLSNPAKLIIQMQFREAEKKNRGGRFTHEEKQMSLAIYQQNSTTYRYLRNIFILPSPTVFKKMCH